MLNNNNIVVTSVFKDDKIPLSSWREDDFWLTFRKQMLVMLDQRREDEQPIQSLAALFLIHPIKGHFAHDMFLINQS